MTIRSKFEVPNWFTACSIIWLNLPLSIRDLRQTIRRSVPVTIFHMFAKRPLILKPLWTIQEYYHDGMTMSNRWLYSIRVVASATAPQEKAPKTRLPPNFLSGPVWVFSFGEATTAVPFIWFRLLRNHHHHHERIVAVLLHLLWLSNVSVCSNPVAKRTRML